MELTRRQLKEDFKPYEVIIDKPLVSSVDVYLVYGAPFYFKGVRITNELGVESDIIMDGEKESIKELISRNCNERTIGFQTWEGYDLDEAKPFTENTTNDILWAMGELRMEIHRSHYCDDYAESQLKKAKLELINRN